MKLPTSPLAMRKTRLIATIAVVAVVWSLSSYGYFWFLPVLDVDIGYNEAPWFYATYYALWTAMAMWVFHPEVSHWARRKMPAQNYALPPVLLLLFAGFALFALPRLPTIDWSTTNASAELLQATSAYFIPKSVEILFQQVLVTALILALLAQRYTLKQISVLVAVMFGGFHLMLALNGYSTFYVARYTVAASLFGAMLPYLKLRSYSGFALAYGIHWGWYALDATVGHFVLA